MPRIRTIKPGFFSSEDLSSVSIEAHLFAAGVLCYADDDGYFNANPALLKAAVFPLRDVSVGIQELLIELALVGFVRLGTGADGRRYGVVVKFNEHQCVNRPTPSKIKPLPIDWDKSVSPHGPFREDSGQERKGNRNGMEGNGEEETKPSTPQDADTKNVSSGELSRFVTYYNDNRGSLRPVRRLIPGWTKKLKARLKSSPTFEPDFQEAVKHAARTPFLRGENERGWLCDFDWLIRDDTHVVKVLEGTYDGSRNAKRNGNGLGTDRDLEHYKQDLPDGVAVSQGGPDGEQL